MNSEIVWKIPRERVKEPRAACRELWGKSTFSFIILWAAQRGHSFTTCLLWIQLILQSSPLKSFYMEVSCMHSWISTERQALTLKIWRQEVEISCILRTEAKIKHMMAITGENHRVYPYSKRKEPIFKSNEIAMYGTKISTN